MSWRPGWLYPKSPVRFGFWNRLRAGVRLLLFMTLLLGGLALASLFLRDVLAQLAETDDDPERVATPPTTIVGGNAVAFMQPVECEETDDDEEPCPPPGSVLIGNDVYLVNLDPRIEVIEDEVSSTVFAAGSAGAIDRAHVIDGVDPAVLLAGRSGSNWIAVTGPSVESPVAEPTIEQIFTICVTITDLDAYELCDRLAQPPEEE